VLIWDTLGLPYFLVGIINMKIQKNVFFITLLSLNFLNSDQGVPTNPKRKKFIPEWPTPPTIRKIWGFHDLTNFCKRFVPYFPILVAPLILLVRNHVPSWEDAQEMGGSPTSSRYHRTCSPWLTKGADNHTEPPHVIGLAIFG